MARTREIKKRMVAVKNIQRITKTMQMIATAKFTAALARAKATQPYTRKIRELVAAVSSAAGDIDHPLLAGHGEKATKKELLLVIVSDRGLCGAYNGNVLRMATQHLRESKSRGIETTLEVSGKKAVGFFRFAKISVARRHTQFGDKPSVEEVHRLANEYMERFTRGEYDVVRVAFMHFESNSRQKPELMQLLPLTPPKSAGEHAGEGAATTTAPYEYSPDSKTLLAELLPASVRTSLFQAFNESVVSEQVMRMIAMKAATDNAGQLGKSLKRDFNRARQTQITTELMEVISGAAALG